MSDAAATAKRPDILPVEPLRWVGEVDGYLRILDQTRLPSCEVWIDCVDVSVVWEAIRSLRVRGAPAIGLAAAYGVCLSLRSACGSTAGLCQIVNRAAEYLSTARPTAVNLFWALSRMRRRAVQLAEAPPEVFRQKLLEEAFAIHQEDRRMCEAIGRWGASLLPEHACVLTHCNTGALATGGIGTALGIVYTAVASKKKIHVYVDETRPLLQGARLTAWELMRWGISCTLICDSMAGALLARKKIDAVIVGADRIAARGDTANKIGTYGLAVLARHHGVPFYVAAPSSTFDLSLDSGQRIPIEERHPDEVRSPQGVLFAPADVPAWNPAFDVTPAELITAIICEKGVICPVTKERIAEVLESPMPQFAGK
ncbi:MAG: S-methyl-5-thioribose-1-phosphate isomerase [Thermoguttaceae bacterium]|nr:S-methyl-5-thioribose-1-phosphate isomerase [Thermoguttaceae bacterium]MDW8078459.1 S-methyl-5-thioribose-1-phosphate isomerase [Thermoguttaceae bacterium]